MLSGGTDLEAGFLAGGLLGEEAGGEVLLHVGRDENAAEAVLRFGATMDTNATASGDLLKDWEQAFKLRTHRHLYLENQGRNEMVGILESVADVVAAFHHDACTFV